MPMRVIHILIKSILLFGILILNGCLGSKQTDWTITYGHNQKKPFGTFILYNELESFFPDNETVLLKKNPYDFLTDNYNEYYDNYDVSGTYMCIDQYTSTLDEAATKEILNFVSTGNTAFIAANSFNDTFKTALNFNLEFERRFKVISYQSLTQHNGNINLVDFNTNQYNLDKAFEFSYFSEVDASTTTILGHQEYDSNKHPNFIRIQYGQGYVYLHSQPIVFTNYYLLKHQEYVSNALSHIPNEAVIWDPHIRYRRNGSNSSSLSYILSQKNLKTALLLGVFSVALFIFFNAKRRQRIIPILTPLQNSTVDFTKTIGNLYFQQNNTADLINKKIVFFLEKIRTDHLMDTKNLNQDFIKKLAEKSGKPIGEIKLLVNTIHKLKNNSLSSKEDLFRLNQLIEKFYNS